MSHGCNGCETIVFAVSQTNRIQLTKILRCHDRLEKIWWQRKNKKIVRLSGFQYSVLTYRQLATRQLFSIVWMVWCQWVVCANNIRYARAYLIYIVSWIVCHFIWSGRIRRCSPPTKILSEYLLDFSIEVFDLLVTLIEGVRLVYEEEGRQLLDVVEH